MEDKTKVYEKYHSYYRCCWFLGKMHSEAILEMGKSLCITDINFKKLQTLYLYLKKISKEGDYFQ